jgi:hypothetical protein
MTSFNWAIVPFRLKLNYITPSPLGYEPIGSSYLQQMFTGEGAGHGNLVDYFLDVSHGKFDISNSMVFPWLDLPTDSFTLGSAYVGWGGMYFRELKILTDNGVPEEQANWIAAIKTNTALRDRVKQLAHDEMKKVGLDVSSYSGLIFVVEGFVGNFMVIADGSPRNDRLPGLDLCGVASEMGHALGLEDSIREGAGEERTDYWDLMSVYGPRLGLLSSFDKSETAYFAEGGVRPPGTPPLPFMRHGPGLNAANMQIMGWLDNSRVHTVSGAETVVLRPLHRRDLPGTLVARVGDYLLEFRTNEKWDAGLPMPCVLMHQIGVHPFTGRTRSVVKLTQKGGPAPRPEMFQEDTFEQGDILDIFSKHIRLTVVEINPAAHLARLSVSLRPGRQPPSIRTFGGVDVGGGGLIWTPGRGFRKIPPDSPLRKMLEIVAAIEELRDTSATESRESREQVHRAVVEQVDRLGEAFQVAAKKLRDPNG